MRPPSWLDQIVTEVGEMRATTHPPISYADLAGMLQKLEPPRKILLCAPGRAEPIRAALAASIARETDLFVRAAFERIEVRESSMCTEDVAMLVTHPDDVAKTLGPLPRWFE